MSNLSLNVPALSQIYECALISTIPSFKTGCFVAIEFIEVKSIRNIDWKMIQQITSNVSIFQGDDAKNKGKKKKSADLIELPLEGVTHGYTGVDMENYRGQEVCIALNRHNHSIWSPSNNQ